MELTKERLEKEIYNFLAVTSLKLADITEKGHVELVFYGTLEHLPGDFSFTFYPKHNNKLVLNFKNTKRTVLREKIETGKELDEAFQAITNFIHGLKQSEQTIKGVY